MQLTAEPSRCSWNVPVPVRRSGFLPLSPGHADYNIETEPARLGPFGLDVDEGPGDVLFADLQTNADFHSEGRLGSGRSGHYRGRYLKGIGRTPLAANWADPRDRYHNSGHLLPSGAVREYLVSRLFDAAGLAGTICACDGLLVRPLQRPIDAFLGEMMVGATDFAPIDRRFQAITVKAGDFARFSNFLWALDHLSPSSLAVAQLFHRMHHYLVPPEARPVSGTTPEILAAALGAAFDRALRGFRAYLRLGVYWGSFHNNFTADGRFLDLELPLVVGRPYLGTLLPADARPDRAGPRARWIGLEVFHYVRQARAFVGAFLARLDHLAANVFRRDLSHDFLAALAAAIRALAGSHPIFSRRATIDHAVGACAAEMALAPEGRRTVERLAETHYLDAVDGEEPQDGVTPRLRRLDCSFAALEPGRFVAAHHPEELGDRMGATDLARAYNQGLRHVEASTTVDELFERVRGAETELRRLAPAP
jgi:hypothetical protein